MSNLSREIAESASVINCGRLPRVAVKEIHLVQLFQNIIGNALKYCDAKPEIYVSAYRDGHHWRIAVRDNGIGIAPEHHERVFGLFQRLHSRAQYPGSGIGLATCKRIIERTGGRIWVESAVGKGSTFFFTLPAVETGEGLSDSRSPLCAAFRG